jgi:hypothetical protein
MGSTSAAFILYGKTRKQSSSYVLDDRFIHYVIYYTSLYIGIIKKTLHCCENVSYPKYSGALTTQRSEKLSRSSGRLLLNEILNVIQDSGVVFAGSKGMHEICKIYLTLKDNGIT